MHNKFLNFITVIDFELKIHYCFCVIDFELKILSFVFSISLFIEKTLKIFLKVNI